MIPVAHVRSASRDLFRPVDSLISLMVCRGHAQANVFSVIYEVYEPRGTSRMLPEAHAENPI